MNFKITDALYAGYNKSFDAKDEFLSQIDKWKTKSRSNKKSINIDQSLDQRNQPYFQSSGTHSDEEPTKQSHSIHISNQDQELIEDSPICKLPKIDPVKTLPTHVISLSNDQISYSDENEDIYNPNNYIVPQKDPSPNPVQKLLECEIQLEKLEKEKKEEQKKRKESNFLKKTVLPQIFNKTEKLKTPQNPSLLSDDYYINNLVDKGDWSVIWDPKKLKKIPLILDKSDKYVSPSDSSDSEPKSPKDWNSLNLLDEKTKYYSLHEFMEDKNEIEIRHSDAACSLSLFEPNLTTHRNFHHPVYKPILKKEMTIEIQRSNGSQKNGSFQLNSVENLSGKNGKIFLIENISENQPFILNVGMNSILVTYFLVDDGFDSSSLSENFQKNLKIVTEKEKSPFVAQLPLKKPVQALYSPLFRMPIAPHSKSETDFLLIKNRHADKFIIRRFDEIFCAGMSEPQQEVMKPNSTAAQKIHDKIIEAFLINVFRGTSEMKGRKRVSISQLQHSYFQGTSQNKIRDFVKKYANYNKNGFWELKNGINLDFQFERLGITPEKVCSYQSMLHGLWNLRKKGVNILKCQLNLRNHMNELKGEKTKIISEKIELELLKTPWMKTSNFIGAFQSNAIEISNADGENVYSKKSRRSKNHEKRESITSNENDKKDLRVLTQDDLNRILSNNGFTNEQIEKMKRWDKVKIVRQLANSKQEENPDDELSRNYSRKKNKFQEMCEKYKNYYQQSFDTNLITISSTSESTSSISTEKDGFDIDEDSFLNELGQMINNENEEEEEIPDFENEINNDSKKSINLVDDNDPPQFVPYGICTYPSKIDWKSFGFDPKKVKMRPVVKFIRVSMKKNGAVSANVEWIRDPQEINECRKKNNVYQEMLNNPVDEKRKKNLKKKSKSKKIIKVDENGNKKSLVSKDKNNEQIKIQISCESMNQINDARETYSKYKKDGK